MQMEILIEQANEACADGNILTFSVFWLACVFALGLPCNCFFICFSRFLKFKKQQLAKRSLCCTCGLLLLSGEVTQHEEQGHQLKHRVSRAALRSPTTLFDPQEDSKTFAVSQYVYLDGVYN